MIKSLLSSVVEQPPCQRQVVRSIRTVGTKNLLANVTPATGGDITVAAQPTPPSDFAPSVMC